MKILTKIVYYGLIVGIGIMGLLLLFTMVPSGNLAVKIVKSGSMEPAIKTGGVIFVRSAPTYKVGDVITFGADTKTQIPTTHRIVSVEKDSFITKGDANDVADPSPISTDLVKGKVVFSLPYLGFILDFAKKPLGFILLVAIPATILIFDELYKILKEIKRMRQKKVLGNQPLNSRILDLRVKPQQFASQLAPRSNVGSSWKMFVALIIVFGSVIGLGNVKSTISYYNEQETGGANSFTASDDFGLSSPLILFAEAVIENTSAVLGTSTLEIIPEPEIVETEIATSTEEMIPENIEPNPAPEPVAPLPETIVIEQEVEKVVSESEPVIDVVESITE